MAEERMNQPKKKVSQIFFFAPGCNQMDESKESIANYNPKITVFFEDGTTQLFTSYQAYVDFIKSYPMVDGAYDFLSPNRNPEEEPLIAFDADVSRNIDVDGNIYSFTNVLKSEAQKAWNRFVTATNAEKEDNYTVTRTNAIPVPLLANKKYKTNRKKSNTFKKVAAGALAAVALFAAGFGIKKAVDHFRNQPATTSVSDTVDANAADAVSDEKKEAEALRKEYFADVDQTVEQWNRIAEDAGLDEDLRFDRRDYVGMYLYANNEDVDWNEMRKIIGNSDEYSEATVTTWWESSLRKVTAMMVSGKVPANDMIHFFDGVLIEDDTKTAVQETVRYVYGQSDLEIAHLQNLMATVNPVLPNGLATVMVYQGTLSGDLYNEIAKASDLTCDTLSKNLQEISDRYNQLEKYGNWDPYFQGLEKYVVFEDQDWQKVYDEAAKEGTLLNGLPNGYTGSGYTGGGSTELPAPETATITQTWTPEQAETRPDLKDPADKEAGTDSESNKDREEQGYDDAQDVVDNDPNIEGPVTPTPPPATEEEVDREPGKPVIDIPTDGPIEDENGNVIGEGSGNSTTDPDSPDYNQDAADAKDEIEDLIEQGQQIENTPPEESVVPYPGGGNSTPTPDPEPTPPTNNTDSSTSDPTGGQLEDSDMGSIVVTPGDPVYFSDTVSASSVTPETATAETPVVTQSTPETETVAPVEQTNPYVIDPNNMEAEITAAVEAMVHAPSAIDEVAKTR